MIAFKSIRFRLTAWYTAMLLIGLAVFGAVIFAAGHYALIASIDARLEDRVSRLGEPLARELEENEHAILRLAAQPELAASVFPEAKQQLEGLRTEADRREFARTASRRMLEDKLRALAGALPAGDFLDIRDAAGRRVTQTAIEATLPGAPSAQPRFGTVAAGGREYRALEQSLDIGGEEYNFLTGASTAPIRSFRHDAAASLWWLGPLFLLLSVLGGSWMSARALRPIDEVTSAAQSIGIHDLSQRLEVPETQDELRRLTETWNGMLERLETAVRQLQQFTADASHELRTPTAAVRATAELALRRERTPEEYRTAIGKILRESGRMGSLIEDLLMLARADQSDESMPVGAVDFDDLAAETCDDYAVLAEQKPVRLERRLQAAGAKVSGNKAALRRLTVALLDNAIKYSPAGGAVVVETGREREAVTLRIRDEGPGIPEEALPHLFDRFYRSDSSRARTIGGAGLGLALAKSIAERHGASLMAENLPGGGAQFSVRMPFAG
jgi:heavy metal sensor kinase